MEYRGAIALDITRASDGATLEDVLLDTTPSGTYDADDVTATFDYSGPAMVIATEDEEIVEDTTEYVLDLCDCSTEPRPRSVP